MNADRELIADLLSALEYHVDQTRPIHSSTAAIQAASEYLKKPAADAKAGDEPVDLVDLLREARDNCKASIAESGISADRKAYRIELEARLTAALTTPPAQPAREWVGLDAKERYTIIRDSADEEDAIRKTESRLREKNAGQPAAKGETK